MPTSASVLLPALPRRSPLRLLQVEKQYARHEWTIYPKSNDRFGLKKDHKNGCEPRRVAHPSCGPFPVRREGVSKRGAFRHPSSMPSLLSNQLLLCLYFSCTEIFFKVTPMQLLSASAGHRFVWCRWGDCVHGLCCCNRNRRCCSGSCLCNRLEQAARGSGRVLPE